MRPIERAGAQNALALAVAGLTAGLAFPAHAAARSATCDTEPLPTEPAPSLNADIRERYGRLPLGFEPNQGQCDPRVRYLARGSGYTLFLTGTEAALAFRGVRPACGARSRDAVLRLRLLGARTAPAIVGENSLPGRSHYLIGDDPDGWRRNVPSYARVRLAAVYPGIDLVYYGNQRELEYDFLLAPGADPDDIALALAGARSARVDRSGDLRVTLSGGTVCWRRPVAYQEINGARRPVAARYRLAGGRLSFRLGRYDRRRPLVIDPVLSYSTYLGGAGNDQAVGIAVDAAGSAYVTGVTASAGFPVVGAAQPTPGGGSTDAFVTKLDPTGASVLYSTFLGGSAAENTGTFVGAVAVDGGGHAHVTGRTDSLNFPTVNALQSTPRGAADAFVARLSPDGSTLLYSTYLGGAGLDFATGIAVDAAGHAYVAGRTESSSFPTTSGALDTVLNGPDAFVAKIDPTLSGPASLLYATYLGGSGQDYAGDIAVDGEGNACVVGFTMSGDFPTANAAQPAFGGGFGDAFVAKLNGDGSGLLYGTYLGGSGSENSAGGGAIAVDGAGRIAVTGSTTSGNFRTTPGAYDTVGSGIDAFVALIDPTQPGTSSLLYSTLLGGSGGEEGYGVAIDAAGMLHVAGRTASADFPLVEPIQAAFGQPAGNDAFVAKLDPTLTGAAALRFSTYLGGSGSEYALDIAVDTQDNAYVAGFTQSPNFPVTAGAFDTTANAGDDAFVAKIRHIATANLALVQSSAPGRVVTGHNLALTFTLRNHGPGVATEVLLTDLLPSAVLFLSADATEGGIPGGSGNRRTMRFPTLAPGVEATITLVAAVPDTVADGTPLDNSATVQATTVDPDTGDNEAAATVTADNPPPVITLPADLVRPTDPGSTTAVVTFPDPEVTDNGDGTTVVCEPASGAAFPMGTTTVTCTATDSGGATATATFTVTVVDAEPPTLACPPDVTASTDPGRPDATVTLGNATASDNASGVTVTGARADGRPLADPYPVGTTTVTWTATDAAGNVATGAQTVTVHDTEAPTVACPADMTAPQDSEQGATVSFAVTAGDNRDGVTVACSPPSGSLFPVGTTTVTCTATDVAGNTTRGAFTVTVTPTTHTSRARVTGCGMLAVPGGKATFGLLAMAHRDASVRGLLTLGDPARRRTLRSTALTSMTVTGTRARILGRATVNGRGAVTFVLEVEDLGRRRGGPDRFTLRLSDGYCVAGSVANGRIEIQP